MFIHVYVFVAAMLEEEAVNLGWRGQRWVESEAGQGEEK